MVPVDTAGVTVTEKEQKRRSSLFRGYDASLDGMKEKARNRPAAAILPYSKSVRCDERPTPNAGTHTRHEDAPFFCDREGDRVRSS